MDNARSIRHKGFTLIELLVVISIISLLSSVVLSSLNAAREKGRRGAIRQFSSTLDHALGASYAGVWDFDECSGPTTSDRSGSGTSGTLIGGLAWSVDTVSGTGCSLLFDGVDDWLNNVAQPVFPTTPNVFTVAFAIKPDNQYGHVITPQSNGVDQWIEYDQSSQRIGMRVAQSADTNERLRPSSTGSVPYGRWSHVAISVNDKAIKIYINGKLDAEYTETIDIGAWAGLWAVGQRGISTNWFKGNLDQLRIYATVLGASEIGKLYAAAVGRSERLSAIE
ncbi:MAG: LamG domain-containing protein [Candidatus Taylorbacteria bacterium]|nr:LamG domain-containing protein [Candidatus Taylorbacteria bacterium]